MSIEGSSTMTPFERLRALAKRYSEALGRLATAIVRGHKTEERKERRTVDRLRKRLEKK